LHAHWLLHHLRLLTIWLLLGHSLLLRLWGRFLHLNFSLFRFNLSNSIFFFLATHLLVAQEHDGKAATASADTTNSSHGGLSFGGHFDGHLQGPSALLGEAFAFRFQCFDESSWSAVGITSSDLDAVTVFIAF
jgi:hypothetical protein